MGIQMHLGTMMVIRLHLETKMLTEKEKETPKMMEINSLRAKDSETH
jgi:hypothetical protein